MKKTSKPLVLHWAVAALGALGPAGPTVENRYRRFEEMLFDSKIEDVFTNQAEKAALRPSIKSAESNKQMTPAQKVEWSLRLGSTRFEISLADLARLSDASLIDEGLKAYLDAKAPDVFAHWDAWWKTSVEVGTFLRRHPLREQILTEANGPLWRFILGDTRELKDPMLLALTQMLRAQKTQASEKFKALCLGRYYLSSSQSAQNIDFYDRRMIDLLYAEYGNQPEISALIANFDDSSGEVQMQKIALLRKLQIFWQEKNQMRLAADALSRIQILLLKFGDPLNPEELLSVADLELEAGQNNLARQFYSKAATASERKGRWLHAKAVAGLAVAAEKEAYTSDPPSVAKLEWASEYYRRALEENFGTDNSDILLENYGLLLARLNHSEEAIRIFEVLFKNSRSATYKARGLGLAADIALARLSQVAEIERGQEFKRYLGYLGFLSSLAPKSAELKIHYGKAKSWQQKLLLTQDPATQASMFEVEKALRK